MRDPEIQSIMSDPVFQEILKQAQDEPASMLSHMKNPEIKRKIELLIKAVRSKSLFLLLRSFTSLVYNSDAAWSISTGYHSNPLNERYTTDGFVCVPGRFCAFLLRNTGILLNLSLTCRSVRFCHCREIVRMSAAVGEISDFLDRSDSCYFLVILPASPPFPLNPRLVWFGVDGFVSRCFTLYHVPFRTNLL